MAFHHAGIEGLLIWLNDVWPVKRPSPGAVVLAVVFVVVVLVFVAYVVANPTPYVSSPVYRQDPLIGDYPFIKSSGVVSEKANNKTYVVAYVYLNLTEVKPGDSFSLYVPLNVGSQVPKAFYENPVLKLTVVNATVFYNGTARFLNFTAKVTSPSVPGHGTAGGVLNLENSTGVVSFLGLGVNTLIFVEVLPENSTVLKMYFFVAPA